MILDEISFHDFGLYEGKQCIALTPPAPDKPIVLIGGLNGGGKTTFLDALQLVLFGPHAKCSNRGSLGYQEYLSRCIHRAPGKSEAGIELSFRHTVDGQEENYTLSRSWKRSGGGCKERFEVIKNGQPEPTLADNWATQVEEFFPANIAHLFLFDGEQVEAYASDKDSSALIGAAIQNLLGLDMVDQLEKDLQVYERRKRSDAKDDARGAEISKAQDELRDLRGRLDALKQERAALQTHRLDKQERVLRSVEEKYKKIGGALYDQRNQIERKYAEAVTETKNAEMASREFAAGAGPFLLVRDLMEATGARDLEEEKCRRARDLADTLKDRDKATLKHLRTQSVDKKLADALKTFFEKDRAEREALGQQESLLDLAPDVRADLHSLLRGDLSGTCDEALSLIEQLNHARLNEEQARVEYESVPNTDTVEQLAKEREELRAEIADLRAMLGALGQEIERQQRDLERREASLARLLEDDVKTRGKRDDRSRILHHSAKVRKTLETFRHAVIERHVRRIEQLVLESYRQLLRKSGLVTRLAIDPQDYALTLYGRDGEALSAERLSAGERQLLAIALLWGLAKASGRPLPTAIDTPLGRLDSTHRIHLIERYLPFASHQVLLLSTDEEIAGGYHERLAPWIGHTYQLTYDDEGGATRIAPGYLASKEAA